MNKYLRIFNITLQEYFVYRLNMFMWRVRQVFVFLLPYFMWSAVFQQGVTIYGYDFGQIMTYLFGTTILRSLIMGSRTVDLGWMINSGMLTVPLMRPLNMFAFLMTRDAADKLFNLSFMFLEIPLILLIFHPPVFLQANIFVIIFTFISILLSIFIYFYINIIFGSLGFWTRDVWAPRFLLMVIMEFTTGAMFPLDMLNRGLQALVFLTPFPYLLFVPLKIYLGDPSTLRYLTSQMVWSVVLYLFARFTWQRGLRRYESEGR